MDHQVKNDTDIGPAGLVRGYPDSVNESGMDNICPHRLECRIEPLKMPDLKDQAVAVRNRDQIDSLFYCRRYRFFKKNVDAFAKKECSHFIMHSGRDDY